jgi:hypothetical protein
LQSTCKLALERFASHTEDEKIKQRHTNVPVNTEQNNKKAASLLRAYLTETKQSSNFEALSAKQLNDVLKHLYLSARKADGEMYKVNTLVSTRYSLNRYLKSPPVQKTFDIIKDNEFNEANMCFKTAITELRANGKGTTEHHPIVSEEDRKKYTLQFTLVQIRHLDCTTKYSGIFACIFSAVAPKICEA